MELLWLLGLTIVSVVVATPIVAFVAFRRTGAQSEEIRLLRAEIVALRRWVRRLSEGDTADVGEAPDPAEETVGSSRSSTGTTSVRAPAEEVAASRSAPATGAHEATDAGAGAASVATPVEDVASAPHSATSAADPGDGGAPAGPGAGPDLAEDPTPRREPSDEPAASGAAPGADAGRAGTAGSFWEGSTNREGGGEAEDATGREAARAAVDFETLIGSTWVLRIGLGILAIALALFARSVLPQLPAVAKVALAYAGAMGLFVTGRYFEESLERFARPVMAAGLTFGFFVAFAAHFVPAMSAVTLPVSIAWMVVGMGTVLVAAERWRSPSTAALAIVLGHVSAFVAAGDAHIYSLIMIAFLAVTAVILMLRHRWTTVGLLAIAASYGSHLLWVLADRDPIPGDLGFWLNLAFLTSYYTIFLIGDVLWWRRDVHRDEGDVEDAQMRSVRQTGPTNLVLYASLTSFVYLITGARVETIEWFYLTLGAVQGGLAWYYWRIEHRDFVFYPAFGTVLWTLGWFAALDALALNLVLASQALLLLIAAHHTRLLVFHALAQLALGVAFVHYLAYPTPTGSSLGLFLGGLGIAAVYLLKASLEEVWYGEEWSSAVEDADAAGGEPHVLERAFSELFRPVAPYLAHAHAGLGGFVLARELVKHLGVGRETGMALVAAGALIAGLVLFRKRGALLFAFTVLAVSGPYVAAEGADALTTFALLGGLSAVAIVLIHLLDAPQYERIMDLGALHAQVVAVMVLFGVGVAIDTLEIGFASYLPAMIVPLSILAFQERLLSRGYASEESAAAPPASPRARVSWAACVGVALIVYGLTIESVGVVALAPVWVAGWSIALALASVGRRSGQLFLASYVLLCWGYLDLATRSATAWGDALGSLWIGAFVTLAPLAFAVGMDRALNSREEAEGPPPAMTVPMTYLMYAMGLFLASALAAAQVPSGWSVLTPALFGLVLMVVGSGLRAERAAPAVVAAFVGLHLVVFSLWVDGPGVNELLIPLLLFAVATMACERLMVDEPPDERLGPVWGYSRIALVVLAASTAMIAIYESSQLGRQWATAGWSVLGVTLMGSGFAFRSSNHRRVALIVLGVCLVRVFLVDTQGLSDTARTGVFFVLGLCLVGVAWLYSKFSEELKSWL